jgi:predicted oxidoreductase
MEQLVGEGAAKTIGVSNFSERQLGRLCGAARIKPAVNQVELHPLLSQRRLVGACARKVKCTGRMSTEELHDVQQPLQLSSHVLQASTHGTLLAVADKSAAQQ